MRSKKGFTLIELLAVIVILAVIALIATPIIMNVINDSKEGAAKDAMYGYVKAVELAGAKQISPTTDAPDGDYTTENGNLKKGSEVLEITIKGTKPANNGTVTLSKGSVVKATLEFDGITVEYNGKKAEVGEVAKNAVYNAGDVIYYNPETNKKCTSSEAVSTTGTKSGCMKWNVIVTNDIVSNNSIDVMLDHNTSSLTAWISSEDYNNASPSTFSLENPDGPDTPTDPGNPGDPDGPTDPGDPDQTVNNDRGAVTLHTQLQKDITTWDSTVKKTGRIILATEIATINGNQNAIPGMAITNENKWLIQTLKGNGDKANTLGYWTSTTYGSTQAYALSYSGILTELEVNTTTLAGIRPVITIQKSVIA